MRVHPRIAAGQHLLGAIARGFNQVEILFQVCKAQQRHPALLPAEKFARPAQAQVRARDLEPVGGFEHHFQSLACPLRQRSLVEQDAHALVRTAPDPAAQLMQLRKTETLRMFDHHQRGVGHIDAHLDDGGSHQHLRGAGDEVGHHGGLFVGFHAPMHQPDFEIGQLRGEVLVGFHRGLEFEGFGLLDQRAHPVHLAAGTAGSANPLDHLCAPPFGQQLGDHGCASRRQLVDHRDVEVGIEGHGQRARDRCRAHHQLVRQRHAFVAQGPFAREGQTLLDAKAMLLVDNGQAKALEHHLVLEQGVCAHGQRRSTVGGGGKSCIFSLLLQTAGQPRDVHA